LVRGKDVDDPKVKAEIARQVLPLIEDVANPVEREAHRQALARRLRVDERALVAWRPAPRRRARPRGAGAAPGAAETVVGPPVEASAQERFCLGVLLHSPELIYRIDRELQSLELERLSGQDFTGTDRQVIFQAIRAALAQDDTEPADHWRGLLALPLGETADALLREGAQLDLQDPRAVDEVVAGFLRLRKRNLGSVRSQLQFQLQEAQEAGETQVIDLQREVVRITRDWDRIDRALARRRPSP
jgi:DNA primase